MSSAENKDAPATPGPGAKLREKRIANNWSVADVANELRLSSAQLTALEEDDYKNLPGETYVQGYQRNYARLLGITTAELTGANATHNAAAKKRAAHSQTREPQRHYLTFLFAFLLIVFLSGIWYWQNEPNTADDDVAVTPNTTPNSFDTDSPATTIARPEANFAEQHTSRLSPNGISTDVLIPPTPNNVPDTISFNVRDASWLEVQDGTGNYLIARRVPGGERLQLAGESPFNVFIGNAAGVTVRYHGESVPVSINGAGIFARFKVGAE